MIAAAGLLLVGLLAISGINPFDRGTWLMEVAPVLVVLPLGFQLQDWLHLDRNPYDRIGHFFQGFVPVIAAREVLLRHLVVRRGPMLIVLLLSVVLAVSACYEFIEWGAAVALGSAADDFLGTQGDPWDTQWDMFLALVGAGVSLLLISGLHDRQLARLAPHDRQAAGVAAA